MKVIIILFLLLLTATAFGELTKEDLRTIIKEEVRPIIKEEITVSEKRMKEYIDLKIETVNARIDGLDKSLNARIDGLDKSLNARIDALDKRIGDMRILVIALIALITAAIAIPQIIIAYKERGQKEMQTQIETITPKNRSTGKRFITPPSPSSRFLPSSFSRPLSC